MIIIINGSINSGKSTVAKLLAAKLTNTAHIEVDKLREFVDFIPLTSELIELNLQNTAAVCRNFIDYGLDVIITYPLSKDNFELLLSAIDMPKQKIVTITLSPRLERALTNRGTRELDDWEVERIKHHYKIGINNPEYESFVIDNSDQTPEETTAKIIKYIEEK